jgi:hypothetical protein
VPTTNLQALAQTDLQKLQQILDTILLETSTGIKRKVNASEFYHMGRTADGGAQFKHRHTRNYVYLLPNQTLVVPKTNKAFQKGIFDAMP